MSTTNILDLNNRIDDLEKISHNVEPIQQQIDELKAWTDSGTKDASGNPIILTDGAAFNAVDLKVSLSPIQSGSGTPSPTNVRPITGYTECVVTVKDEEETTQDTATIAFGQTLYGVKVDAKTGKATVDKVCVVLDGSEDENWDYVNGVFFIELSNVKYNQAPISNIFLGLSNRHYNQIPDGCFAFSNNVEYSQHINLRFTQFSTVADFKAWLANNPLQVCYELAIPTELTLTPAELELLKGYNYITTNGDNIELTYQPDNLKADILLTVSQLYGSKISILDGILAGGDTGQVLTKTSDDDYDATWAALPATRTTTKKSEK